jgi:hypothetical protein
MGIRLSWLLPHVLGRGREIWRRCCRLASSCPGRKIRTSRGTRHADPCIPPNSMADLRVRVPQKSPQGSRTQLDHRLDEFDPEEQAPGWHARHGQDLMLVIPLRLVGLLRKACNPGGHGENIVLPEQADCFPIGAGRATLADGFSVASSYSPYPSGIVRNRPSCRGEGIRHRARYRRRGWIRPTATPCALL